MTIPVQRVMIIGAPGSGKSTLARMLGARTGLPVVHIDHIHWMAGWRERPKADKIAMIRPIEDQEHWIIEGGLSATFETRLARADTLIWLDIPIGLRLYRVIQRMVVTYGKNRPDLPDGCPEVIGWHTWEFLIYILTTRRRNRDRMQARHAAFAQTGRTALHITTRKGVADWLDTLPT